MIDPTKSRRDPYEEWDAAYLLGALSATERLEFEAHLSGCARCAGAVADLAGLPGLLGALDDDEALAMLAVDLRAEDAHAADAGIADAGIADARGTASGPVPAHILVGLTARVRLRRRVRSALFGVAGAVAAAVVAAAVVLPITLGGAGGPGASSPPTAAAPAHPTVSAALDAVVPSPITASVALTSTTWGTSISLSCQYRDAPPAQPGAGYAQPGRFALYVTDRNGTTTEVSSWSAGPGATVHASGSTAAPIADIAGVQLRSLNPDRTLLSRSFD